MMLSIASARNCSRQSQGIDRWLNNRHIRNPNYVVLALLILLEAKARESIEVKETYNAGGNSRNRVEVTK